MNTFIDAVVAAFPEAAVDGAGFVKFKYEIPVGGRLGQVVEVALQAPGDYPLSCPPGPHVSPRLGHPHGNVHDSPLGAEWEYWSRPMPGWPQSGRTLPVYMAHLRTLFAQLP